MKIPITREQLNAYDEESDQIENAKEDLEKGITILLNSVLLDLKQRMPLYSKYKYCEIWAVFESVSKNLPQYFYKNNKIWFIERYLQRLNETFIGCDIKFNPNNLCITISWA